MALFKAAQKEGGNIVLNSYVLDYDYMPKLVPYRENQQHFIAQCIKPLLSKRNARNLFIYGGAGVGKTVCIKHVLRELQEEYSDVVHLIYINCWKKDTSFKIVNDVCEQIGYSWTHNKRTDELVSVISSIVNKKSAVIVLDEADKLKDFDFLYSFLEDIYRKTIILITNEKDLLVNLDARVRSRLNAEILEFKPYNKEETEGILKERVEYAFVKNTLSKEAFELICEKSFEAGDIRSGLYLLREAANIAELSFSQNIDINHAKSAIEKFEEFSAKDILEMASDQKDILSIIKENSGTLIKDIFDIYQKSGGQKTYRTFQRKIEELKKANFIELKENLTPDGKVSFNIYYSKGLTEY